MRDYLFAILLAVIVCVWLGTILRNNIAPARDQYHAGCLKCAAEAQKQYGLQENASFTVPYMGHLSIENNVGIGTLVSSSYVRIESDDEVIEIECLKYDPNHYCRKVGEITRTKQELAHDQL